MEISSIPIAVSFFVIITVSSVWKLLNWVWFRLKKLERYLRQQGLGGKSYRFLKGDMEEMMEMTIHARSAPSDFSDDVALRVSPFLHQHVQTYGKNSFIWGGPTPMVNIMKAEHIRMVFTKTNEIGRLYLNPLAKLLAPGIANHEGDKWVKHRKIINPAFHQQKLKMMLPKIHESCKEMIEKWENIISTKESNELDVWPHLQNLSCDIISRAAFGSNYDEGKLIFDLLKELSSLVIQVLSSININIPGWRFVPTKRNRRIKEIDRKIEVALRSIINKRERAVKGGDEGSNDLLGLLIESNLREKNEGGVGLTTQEVTDECRLFYFAGQESTSVLLVWTLILLSKFPHWQSLARDEIFNVFADKKPDFDGLNRLKVVTMILYEVLRLYPPVIVLNKVVNEEIRLGNVTLPAGVQVSLPMVLIHRDPEIWGDDASEFKPERFSDGISTVTNNQVAFFPFGYGPRVCIGQNFALTEAKMALAIILQNFSFGLAPSYVHAPCTVATLQPQYGALLILQKLDT